MNHPTQAQQHCGRGGKNSRAGWSGDCETRTVVTSANKVNTAERGTNSAQWVFKNSDMKVGMRCVLGSVESESGVGVDRRNTHTHSSTNK